MHPGNAQGIKDCLAKFDFEAAARALKAAGTTVFDKDGGDRFETAEELRESAATILKRCVAAGERGERWMLVSSGHMEARLWFCCDDNHNDQDVCFSIELSVKPLTQGVIGFTLAALNRPTAPQSSE